MGSANSSKTNRYWLCPLYSFTSDKTNVSLSKVAEIKRAPPELKRIIREESPTESRYAINNPTDFNWVMQFPSPEDFFRPDEENIPDAVSFALWAMRRHILALRLHKRGFVTPGVVRYVAESGSKLSLLESFETTVCKHGYSEEPIYSLTESDTFQIRGLLKILHTCFSQGLSPPFRITFDRFNSAYYGENEDRLIDQMIAFESLYLGNEQELKYKLALRTAFLLGGTNKKRRTTIFNAMQRGYKLRSEIVHGSKEVDRSRLEGTIPKTEEYLRQSIKMFLLLLSKGHSLKEIREKLLDENILKNEALLA